jgi:vacuolar protein sorting-associated protein 13A/C
VTVNLSFLLFSSSACRAVENPKTASLRVSIYCSYMFLDQTELNLVYRQHARFGRNEKDVSTDVSLSETSLDGANVLKAPFSEGATMTLFSYTQFEPFRSRALIRTPNSNWSKPISLEATGTVGQIDMEVGHTSEAFQVGVSIGLGEGKFYRTKVVKLAPRYIVTNETGDSVTLQQCSIDPNHKLSSAIEMNLENKLSSPLHLMTNKTEKRALRVSLNGEDHWTAPFKVDDVGELDLKLTSAKYSRFIILRVSISLSGATLFVTITKYMGSAPYRVENFTTEAFAVHQMDADTTEEYQLSRSFLFFFFFFFFLSPTSFSFLVWSWNPRQLFLLFGTCQTLRTRRFS